MQNNSFTPLWIETLANHHNDPNHTVGMLKREVVMQARSMIVEAGFDWDDIRTSRSTSVSMVKALVCYHAHQCLHEWMDEREIADLLGLKLSGFKAARYRGREIHGASVA
jgi:hypothetical protein